MKDEEERSKNGKEIKQGAESEEDELGVKSSKGSFSIEEESSSGESESDSEPIITSIRPPTKIQDVTQRKPRVQFQDESQQPRAYQGIDLPVLLKTRDEIIYQLTELYLPRNESQRKKMTAYNRDKMATINDLENDVLRNRKRKIKEEIKAAQAKLEHPIRHTNPLLLLEDVNYLYKEGITTRHFEIMKDKNKYQSASHIGRIVPQKRAFNQAFIDQQKGQIMQQLQEIKMNQQSQENQLKNYLSSKKYNIESDNIINMWDEKVRAIIDKKSPETIQREEEQKAYQEVVQKLMNEDLSLVDLAEDEKEAIRNYLRRTANEKVESKYPLPNFTKVEKQCYTFMHNLNQEDFSYKGQKSAMQSDDQLFLEDLIGQNNNFLGAPTTVSDERFSFVSEHDRNNNNKEISDIQLQEWILEQRYIIMNQYRHVKRRRYWGEPVDCNTLRQIQLDDYRYKSFKNTLYYQRGCQEEQIFKIEKVKEEIKTKDRMGKTIIQYVEKPIENQKMIDIKEYEYFKRQESYFYADLEKRTNVNSIMRNVKRQLGLITDEEFYAQEELADRLENRHFKDKQREKQLEIEQRKEKVCNEINDNFDFHFERRKKELHEVLMKKIQQHEKATQQTSATQQTVAYASGSHALLQAQESIEAKEEAMRDKSKQMINMTKLAEEHEIGEGQKLSDEEMEEVHPQRNFHESAPDDNMRLRVTKSRAYELNHAKCILKLTYTKFDWSEKSLMQFHRPNIQNVFEQLKYEAIMDLEDKKRTKMQAANNKLTSQITISIKGIVKQQEYKDSEVLPDQVHYVGLDLGIVRQDQIEKRIKKTGIINAHEYFKDRYKLSIRDGKFCIFEHIDQNPLFLNNFGMASKLKRYVYSDKLLPQSAFMKRSENQGTRHMGPHGIQILKKKGEKIPLLGQINTNVYKGLTVMENNMFYCPVFYHKPQKSDFLCIIHKDKKGKNSILVRELSDIYVMGQEEPKIEVYNPQSRQYQHFIKRRTQAYVIRFLQENNNYISFAELIKFFPYINDQILKKIIKEINVEVDRHQNCSLTQEYNDEQFRALIMPENICQYENAQFGEQMLKNVGITDIINADKISYATNKFCSEETDKKKQMIARIIEEEVLSTPWNLSQNFIHNRQTRGMMMLEGIGDPSNGHGGYSYLKLPLKISQDSLNKAKINRMYLNPAIQNPKAVTGTDADLRKLSKKDIKNKLIELGFKEEGIQRLTRWQMVALLREKSSQAVSMGMEGENKKFARGVRFTTKKQREMYQKQVNDIFKKQMTYLSKENADFISDMSDTEGREQQKRKINELQQLSNNYQKNIVELKEDIVITNIKQIPNYEILLIGGEQNPPAPPKITQVPNFGGNSGGGNDSLDINAAADALRLRLQEGTASLRCTILRKKIHPVSGDTSKIERVIFCSDPKQIKGFNKRKHKHEVKTKRTKKTSLKEKMQTSKPIMCDYDRAFSETSSIVNQRIPRSEGGDLRVKIGAQSLEGFSDRQSQQISIPLQMPKQNRTFNRYSSQLNQSLTPFSQDVDMQQFQEQPEGKIQIPIMLSLDQEGESSRSQKGKQEKEKKKVKKGLSKFASAAYNDDDFESYKPKTQPTTRRRQMSPRNALNDIFGTVIDSCFIFDKTKIFHYPVKKKDAPNYFDVIKNPVDLTAMRNKAKRNEYETMEQFLQEINQLRVNAEFFNGLNSHIGQMARDLEQHAKEKLEAQQSDIANLEMLVQEEIRSDRLI